MTGFDSCGRICLSLGIGVFDMTDFEKYKEILKRSGTKFEIWQDDTNNVLDVEDENACFSFYFDILTDIAVSTRIYSKIYSE